MQQLMLKEYKQDHNKRHITMLKLQLLARVTYFDRLSYRINALVIYLLSQLSNIVYCLLSMTAASCAIKPGFEVNLSTET